MNFCNYKDNDYVYMYEDHRDLSLFISERKLTIEEAYCEDCRSVDYLIDEGYVKDLRKKYNEPVKVLK